MQVPTVNHTEERCIVHQFGKRLNRVSDAVDGVYLYNDKVYRVIKKENEERTKSIVNNVPLMERLHKAGLVGTSISNLDGDRLLLEHELVDFNSYGSEWSPPAKLDAALMVLRLTRELVKAGLCLWDGHTFNVFMDFTTPKWVDFHSIIPFITSNAWGGEFENHFFLPVGGSQDVWDVEAAKMLSGFGQDNDQQVVITFLDSIEKHLLTIVCTPKETPWFAYRRQSDINLTAKQKSTLSFIEQVKPLSKTFLDIGGNAGWYSHAASKLGYKVVTTDVDEACISELYLATKENGDSILPLVVDFKTCLDVPRKGRKSFAERLSCDVTLSLALLHHLVFFQGCDFPFIAERLNALSKKYAIVQFITREDSYIKHWLETIPKDWYTMDNFIIEMSKHFSKHTIIDSDPIGRKLILFER